MADRKLYGLLSPQKATNKLAKNFRINFQLFRTLETSQKLKTRRSLMKEIAAALY